MFHGSPAIGNNAGSDAFLSEHNTVRAIHNSPALTSNSDLAASAQSHADYMLETGVFRHSNQPYGENLFLMYSQSAPDPATIAAQAVNSWYEEVEDYDYNNPGFSFNTGHFTQVVWKNTTQLGCGIAQGPATIQGRSLTASYVVCNYNPAGNSGGYSSNVLQP